MNASAPGQSARAPRAAVKAEAARRTTERRAKSGQAGARSPMSRRCLMAGLFPPEVQVPKLRKPLPHTSASPPASLDERPHRLHSVERIGGAARCEVRVQI